MKTILKKLTACTTAAALGIMSAGCAAQTETGGTDSTGQNDTSDTVTTGTDTASETNETDAENADTGMGRYVETTVFESGYAANRPLHLTRMDDGRIAFLCLANGKYGLYVSGDEGDTWEFEERDWCNAYRDRDLYTLGCALSPDYSAIVCYTPSSDDGEEFDPGYLLVTPDGTTSDFEMNLEDGAVYARLFAFDGATGRIFASPGGGYVYEINPEEGGTEKLFEAEGSKVYLAARNNLILYAGNGGISLYDLTEQRFIEDAVLQDFIMETYGGIENNDASSYNAFAFPEEDEASGGSVIYIAGAEGLHRHVIGGSAIEQVIDGSLSSLGDPSHKVASALMLDDQKFLVLYGDGKIVKFTYDPNIPTVPNNRLMVYSLEDNKTIRQAVSVFQTNNPDIYVQYETGMEDSGVTREDALQKLSTRLLDGSGPDVIVLDDLPIDSYISKGILMDLSDIVKEIDSSDGVYMNLIRPFYLGESLYAVPAEFRLPVISAQKEMLEKANNLKGVADLCEALREADSDGAMVINKCTGTDILHTFIETCAPAWKTADGTLNEAALREYLSQCKRIFDAQMDGIDEKWLEQYAQLEASTQDETGKPFYQHEYFYRIDNTGYMMGETMMMCGDISTRSTYNQLNSVTKTKGFEDTVWRPLTGQSENVYVPLTITGINAATKNAEASKSFIRTLLNAEVQENTYSGLPVNKKAFEQSFVVEEDLIDENGAYMFIGLCTADGVSFDYEVYVPTEEELARLREWVAQSDTPYIRDTVLGNAVLEEGAKYLNGDTELDAAVQKIIDKVQIYLSE